MVTTGIAHICMYNGFMLIKTERNKLQQRMQAFLNKILANISFQIYCVSRTKQKIAIPKNIINNIA